MSWKRRLQIVLKKKVEDCFEKEGWWLSYTDYWFSNSAWSWSWKSLEIVLKKLEDILDNNCRKSSLMKTLWKHYWQRLKISLESIIENVKEDILEMLKKVLKKVGIIEDCLEHVTKTWHLQYIELWFSWVSKYILYINYKYY